MPRGHTFHGGAVQKHGGSGSAPYQGTDYPPANPSKPQYPPGTPEYAAAGSPREVMPENVAGPAKPIPTNSTLSGARRGATASAGSSTYGIPDTKVIGGPVPQPEMAAEASPEAYTPKDLGGGNFQMQSDMGNKGNVYGFDTKLPPMSSQNPQDQARIAAEADKASAMYNEPGAIRQAAQAQVTGGSKATALEGEDELLKRVKNLAPESRGR